MTATAPRISILDPAPPEVAEQLEADLAALREELKEVPSKQLDRNLLIATWNLRDFGAVAPTWAQPNGDKPARDLRAVRCIAEVVRAFDVVAIQEVQRDIGALAALMAALGPDWGFVMTDTGRGSHAGSERLAFVFDLRRVKPSGLAGELVLSREQLAGSDPAKIHEQLARPPYAVAFQSAGRTFVLTTVHLLWGSGEHDPLKLKEVEALAEWVEWWSRQVDGRDHSLLVLGDFNIADKSDAAYQALTSTGLRTPEELDPVAAALAADPNAGTYYDQIAWFPKKIKLRFTKRGGRVKWKGKILQDVDGDVSFRISDHFPLWAEFATGETDPA